MKRQVLGGFTALLLLMVLGAVSANAHSTIALTVNIPFDFFVGDRSMPAGEYAIETGGLSDQVLFLRNAQGQPGVLFLTYPTETKGKGHADELVFKRYNDRYFLSSIWTADDPIGQELYMSRHERELSASAERPVLRVLLASARR
jgi:hypothetical protein